MGSVKHPIKIGIIGGTGLDDPDIFAEREEKFVDTPFGKPSDALVCGKIKDIPCVLLARHGRKHTINPSNVNYRANLWAMKQEGCTHVLVTTACGSLQEQYAPGDIVVIDQFIDRTHRRIQTFHDGEPTSPKGVCHIPMAAPFCPHTRKVLYNCAKELGIKTHEEGTMLTIEGPRFSSRAESKLWKSWGASVINMTTVPEVVLAKELGLCYGALALVTDYDSWRESEEDHVSVEAVLQLLRTNADKGKNIILSAIPKLAEQDWAGIVKENQDLVKMSTLGAS